MSFNRLLQPKTNPFGVIIYSPKEGNVILKQFSDKIISENELNKFSRGTYCNSFNNLLLSEGKYFWIINNTSFNVRKKKLPIEKNNHSMIFIPCTKGAGRTFIIGGSDKKTFFYDLKKNYFINWSETNEMHNKPTLITIDDYLYIMDSLKQQNFCFERTKLSDNEKRWEKIIPNFDKKIISNFPSGGLAAALDSNGSVVFLGGDNINLMNNSYVYDPENNKVSISLNGTNDSVNFCDKNFYKYNKKYSIALPKDMEEVKEIVMIDKDEQSLIKTHIDLPKNDNYKMNNNQSEYTFPKTKIRSNMIIAKHANMSKVNYRNFNPNIQIKEEPKEFGYYISSNSSEQVRIKASKNRIKMVQFNPKYVPYKIGQAIDIKKEIRKNSQISDNNINKGDKKPEIDNKNNLIENQNQEIKDDSNLVESQNQELKSQNQENEDNLNNNFNDNYEPENNNIYTNDNADVDGKEDVQNNSMENVEQPQQEEEEQNIEQSQDQEVEQQEFDHQEYQPDEENQQINANGEEEQQLENGEEHFEEHENQENGGEKLKNEKNILIEHGGEGEEHMEQEEQVEHFEDNMEQNEIDDQNQIESQEVVNDNFEQNNQFDNNENQNQQFVEDGENNMNYEEGQEHENIEQDGEQLENPNDKEGQGDEMGENENGNINFNENAGQNIDDQNQENVEVNVSNEHIENPDINNAEFNQEQNEQKKEGGNEEEENLKVPHELDFNNAQIQNQNEDDDHFTEPGLHVSGEEHEQQNNSHENANIENQENEEIHIQNDLNMEDNNNEEIHSQDNKNIEDNNNNNQANHNQDENAEDNNNQEIHIQEGEKNVFISGDDNQIVGRK